MIQKPNTDPVIDEIHKVRREISDRFGGDVRAIAADANARMLASGCPIWKPANDQPTHQCNSEIDSPMESHSPPSGDR